MSLINFVRPDAQKILVTLGVAFITGFLLSFSIGGALSFMALLVTPFYTEYADVSYSMFIYYVLLWLPFYLLSRGINYLIMKRRVWFYASLPGASFFLVTLLRVLTTIYVTTRARISVINPPRKGPHHSNPVKFSVGCVNNECIRY